MNDIWFTSDSHFGHANILTFEKEARPFNTIEEMNEHLIHCWNNVVKPGDTVYHLGDFCFGKHNLSIGQRLQGNKRLIMGNHDTYASQLYLDAGFERLYGVKHWEQCILSHMPVHPNQIKGKTHPNQQGYSTLNCHGHYHSKLVLIDGEPDCRYMNLSVEHWNLTPVHADIIRDRAKANDI